MSQRVDQRMATEPCFNCYNTAEKLAQKTANICKVKEKNTNTHRIIKRQFPTAAKLRDAVEELTADIFEANSIFIGERLNLDERIENMRDRISLEKRALRLSFRAECYFSLLDSDRPFAESTLEDWLELLCSTRNLLVQWLQSERNGLREALKGKSCK